MRLLPPTAAAATALLLAACASGPTADVKRFHLGAPVARSSISLEPAPGAPNGLEFQTYAAAVANELRAQGFAPVPPGTGAAYVGVLNITQNVAVGPRRPPPVTIGIGGFGFSGGHHGGGVGLGGEAAIPVGQGRRDAVEFDTVGLQIKRAADQSLIWEGSASAAIDTRSPQATLARAVPALARALLAGFPGPTGVTQRVPLR
ncbi:MAG: DUF4136 domain-containing protein [Sphingomonadaceae bacterium]|nr:DUF4136 domain-containing protein [Sphingomonadaceae bacterium]